MTKDDFETRIQDGDRKLSSRYSATREILQEWYKKGGDSIIETMLAVPGYKKAWKDYVRKFNKEQSLTK